MDTELPLKSQGAAPSAKASQERKVQQGLETLKRYMPRTMECIEDRVQHFGPEARALVRRGLRGEPGCFYAVEAGHVVGCPAGLPRETLEELAEYVVVMGCAHVCIWPLNVWQTKAPAVLEGAHGAD